MTLALTALDKRPAIRPRTVQLAGRIAIASLIVLLAAASVALTPADVALQLGVFASP